jgi:ribosomal protein S18 acetylase RimI-like enzyme
MKGISIAYRDGEDRNLEEFIYAGLSAHMRTETGMEHDPFTITARRHDTIVGGLTAYERNRRIYITFLYVSKEMRGQGIGRDMMRAVEAEAQKRECLKIHVDSAGFQSPDFYARLGYAQIGVIPGFFGEYDWFFFAKELSGRQA